MLRIVVAAIYLVIAAGLSGCSTLRNFLRTTDEQQSREHALEVESDLVAAGFKRIAGSGAGDLAAFGSLPPRQLRYYIDRGSLHYWFSDPDFCKCAFEGNQKAYQRFQQIQLATEQQRQNIRSGQTQRQLAEQTTLNEIISNNQFRFQWF